ncbi:DegT/DnrJ/EryC1/StrS family aminotransferase [Longispora albida]|uniref:DegT/DnrJ/EryC1/StrS family aminotransferase n=1 Tax=Longispora albida TaxID=203523 RepID=UPI0003654DB4|nr:DegT/DnrJ/EryC1/StrS family aminotransferase [Longispora albida]
MKVPFMDLAAMHAPIAEDVVQLVGELAVTSAFIGGRHVAAFEEGWAAYCGTAHAVGVANGTDAIVLTLRALGVGAGDEVLVPANTFIASAAAVSAAGATPVFVDVDPVHLQVTPDTLEAARTERTRAILLVHLYGHIVPPAAIAAYAQRHGLLVVEDAAQAHGAIWEGRKAGSFGVAACFSFYPGKNLGAWGDGGAVVTDDPALAERIRSLANHGRAGGDHYKHAEIGVNSRLDALQAGILSLKVPHLDSWNAAKNEIASLYRDKLAGLIVEPPEGVTSAWHLFVVRVADRDGVRERLGAQGVQASVHYPIPCHQQPAYGVAAHAPVAEAAAGELLSLPMFPSMTSEQVEYVSAKLVEALPS